MSGSGTKSGSEAGEGEERLVQAEFDFLGLIDSATSQKTGQEEKRSAGRRRYFLGWDRSLLDSAVEHVARSWDRKRTLDLSDRLLIVPTRNAGRVLREKLAIFAAEFDGAVIPPIVTTSGYLVSAARLQQEEGLPIADPQTTLLLWAGFLQGLRLQEYRNLFPVDPVERDLNWAMETARELISIRHLLSSIHADFETARELLAAADLEPNRWKELARLEREMLSFTKKHGFQDEFVARRRSGEAGTLPSEVKRVLLLGIPDLPPAVESALQRYSKDLPVEILVFAPPDLEHCFDLWGRPKPTAWLDREIPIPHAEQLIHACPDPGEQAKKIGEIAAAYGEQASGMITIGIPDAELAAPISERLASQGWNVYDPSGVPAFRHGICFLLGQTRRLLEEQSFSSFQQLLRCPDFLNALHAGIKGQLEKPPSPARLVDHFDQLASACLPDRLGDALWAARRNYPYFPELSAAVEWTQSWVKRLGSEEFGEIVVEYLSAIFSRRIFSNQDEAKEPFVEIASAILVSLEAMEGLENFFEKELNCSERLEILLQYLRDQRIYAERNLLDIDLQGWLELPWDESPHLIVAGCNDHLIPETVLGHGFLPNTAREILGLECNEKRFARDAFLFQSLIEFRRATGGRVDFLFGKFSNEGLPLRPSRLLLQCPNTELPRRVLNLCKEEDSAQQPKPWNLPWKLKPQALPEDHKIFQRFTVTAFRSYLQCPFRFYLSHGLGMREFDSTKSEMDAMEFGNLVHNVVEAFGKEDRVNQSESEKEIAEYFSDTLDDAVAKIYGSRLTTPILIQREAARRRLRWWAGLEAAERQEGWSIFEIESDIGSEENRFEIANCPIFGRIDRIEHHPSHGYRVFDFKTGSTYNRQYKRSLRVDERHMRTIGKNESADEYPDWCLTETSSGKVVRWIDLQVPLYVLSLRKRFPSESTTGGYINLGPTLKEVGIDLWYGMNESLLDSAFRCAENIIQSVREEKRFWPPAAKYSYPGAEEEILFGNPLEAVDPSAIA